MAAVISSAYAAVWHRADVRRLIVVAMIARLPFSAANLVLTYDVVYTLHRSWGEAGAAVACFTIGMGISGPWRGRLVDRLGLRRAILPTIFAQAIAWPLAGVVPYWALFPVVVGAGLFAPPIFSVTRKALAAMVPPAERRTAFSLDAVATELIFMVGPALGGWCAMQVGAPLVLAVVGIATAAALGVLWYENPPMHTPARSAAAADEPAAVDGGAVDRGVAAGLGVGTQPEPKVRRRGAWMTPGVVVVLAVSVIASLAVNGTDVGVLALLKELGIPGALAWAYGAWCAGSALGGLLYGAMHRSADPLVLAGILGLVTAPLALAGNLPILMVLLLIAGLLCAPTITAAAESLTHQVPEDRRGEVMGWQGTAFTLGGAIGSPLAGIAIDRHGAGSSFAAVAAVTLLVVGLGALVRVVLRRRRGSGTMRA